MDYHLKGKAMMIEIERSQIIDISSGDTITIDSFPGVSYTWTQQDTEFIENNPDDDVFLLIEETADKNYKACGIQLRAVETIK
jgi:hypothetical protein